MRLVNLRASEVVIRNTKYGEKILITASGDLKSDIKIWRPTTDPIAQMITPNQWFQACVDSQGKYSPVAPTTDPGVAPTPEPSRLRASSLDNPYIPESSYSPLATMPKTKAIQETSGGAYDRHIENLASKIADCYRATKKQLPELSEETIQKLATSVFIQLAKDTF